MPAFIFPWGPAFSWSYFRSYSTWPPPPGPRASDIPSYKTPLLTPVGSSAILSSFCKRQDHQWHLATKDKDCPHRRPSGEWCKPKSNAEEGALKPPVPREHCGASVGASEWPLCKEPLPMRTDSAWRPRLLAPADQHAGPWLSVPFLFHRWESRPPEGSATKTTQRGCSKAGAQGQTAWRWVCSWAHTAVLPAPPCRRLLASSSGPRPHLEDVQVKSLHSPAASPGMWPFSGELEAAPASANKHNCLVAWTFFGIALLWD